MKNTRSITITIGSLIRGTVKRKIKQAAWEAGLEVTLDEEKGLFYSVIRVQLSGRAAQVNDTLTGIQNYIASIGE